LYDGLADSPLHLAQDPDAHSGGGSELLDGEAAFAAIADHLADAGEVALGGIRCVFVGVFRRHDLVSPDQGIGSINRN
jgi:hypothetical protein